MSRLSWVYWFSPRIFPLSPLFKFIFLGIILGLLILAVFSWWQRKNGGKNKKIFSDLYYFALSNFFIGLLLFFFRFEGVTFMTARYWLVLWFLGMAFWLFSLWRRFRSLPERRELDQKQADYLKYLPKKKSR